MSVFLHVHLSEHLLSVIMSHLSVYQLKYKVHNSRYKLPPRKFKMNLIPHTGKRISADILKYFSYFSQKHALTFQANCLKVIRTRKMPNGIMDKFFKKVKKR